MEYLSGIKKADWDVGITVDIMSTVDAVDVIVLASGDGDFVPLAQYVKSHGRRFEVVSFRETTASTLLEWADSYINLSEDKRKFLIGHARQPAVHMTKGGEALVEKDQAESLPEHMPKARMPSGAPGAKTVEEAPGSRLRRLSF